MGAGEGRTSMLDTSSLGWVGGKMRKQNMGGHQAKMAKIKMTIVNKLRATPHPVQSGQRGIRFSYFLAGDKPDLNCTVIIK
jgi:hypothetical protein